MGIPIVASEVTGVVDLVEHGSTGLLGRTASELADALTRVLTDPELAHALSDRTMSAAERFDQSTTATRSLEGYRSLVPLPADRAPVST